MSCLYVIGDNDAVSVGNLNVIEVALAVLGGTMFIAQFTLQECHLMLERGLSALEYR
jgi:hypothetical protein